MTALKILLSFTFSILLASSMLAGPGNFLGAFPESVHAVTRNLTLEGWTGGWNSTLISGTCSPTGIPTCNPTITVSQGDSVDLSLPSGDSAPHQFFIDEDGNPPRPDCAQDKCSDMLPTAYQFIVDFAPGTYKYYCTFHQGPMQGDFVVQGFRIDSSPSSLRVVQGSSNTSTITVTSVNSFSGVVVLSTTVSSGGPTAEVNPTSVTLSAGGTQTSTLAVDAGSTAAGSYTVNVTGTSGSAVTTQTVATLVVARDFGISANPTRLVIPLGSSGSSTITLSSLDSFSGNVDLSTSPPPAGITATFSQNPVTVSSGGTATSMLDVTVSSSTTAGTHTVDVTGTSGSLAHNTTVTVVAGPDFDVSADPAAIALTPGSSDSSTITLTSFNDFAGTVNLTGAVSPEGPTFSLSPPNIVFSGSGTIPSVLAVNAAGTTAASNFTITITAMSGLIVHLINVTVSVRDFSVTVSNANLIVQQGSSTTTTILIASLNRFVGDVSLTTTASSTALARLLNVTTLSLSPSGTGSAILTLNASSVQAGTYTVTLTGTSGSLVRTVSLSLTVQPSPTGVSILLLTGGVAVGAIAIATAGLYYARRRRLGGKASDSQVPT